ncbi:MAG TPA: type II toxin-antitoxin system VapC family toxin [Rhodocyclaceae bacterium]|nr:type II toxin-antitoxin system VapC family toxin [Rhodocyclaceae bacterium]
MYLVDTNVISEARKGAKADSGVRAFWRGADAAQLYLSSITIGEIRRGVENIRHRGDQAQAEKLEQWLNLIVDAYSDRILNFDLECAQAWGKLMSPHPQHPIDKQIAAIALLHDLTVVTRNTADFDRTGVKLFNPYQS